MVRPPYSARTPNPPALPRTRRGSQALTRNRVPAWDGDLSVLERHRVSPVRREWYDRGAEAFVEAVRPTRMGEVSAEQVTGFFLKQARERRLTNWQFRQMVDAAQLLLVDVAQAPAASALDWDYWKKAGSGPDGPAIGAGCLWWRGSWQRNLPSLAEHRAVRVSWRDDDIGWLQAAEDLDGVAAV